MMQLIINQIMVNSGLKSSLDDCRPTISNKYHTLHMLHVWQGTFRWSFISYIHMDEGNNIISLFLLILLHQVLTNKYS